MLGLRPSHLLGVRRKECMKIYHLTIAYNDKTEEIEYIQEEIEEDGGTATHFKEFDDLTIEIDDDYFDDDDLMQLIWEHGLGEA